MTPTDTPHSANLQAFHTDGYLLLPSLLTSPAFLSELRSECLEIFNAVLNYLKIAGAAQFDAPCRRQRASCNNDDNNDNDGSTDKGEYEYPMGVGLKNGYRELVMRAPGRYELALLIDGHDDEITNDDIVDKCIDDEERCYNGKRLLTIDMIERAKRRLIHVEGVEESEQECGESAESTSMRRNRRSCLQQILTWIKQHEKIDCVRNREHDVQQQIEGVNIEEAGSGVNNDMNYESIQDAATAENIDKVNFESFMELVSAIFPPPTLTTDESNEKCSTNDTTTFTHVNTTNNIASSQQNEFYLCNFSLLLSTPGSPTQSWHADGGHTSLTSHLPCHVFNVFLPLVDVPLSMGPTELRPGSHVYTRDLTRMMLLAKIKKTLRDVVVPELKRGDGLLFDYRILHRGRANLSDVDEDQMEGEGDEDDECAEEVTREDNSDRSNSNKYCRGRDRPVLVLTFARRWFLDVCNFPKRSIFSLQEIQEE